ncbi:hypothetical protein AA19596_2279 [Acetobacter fabarum DSM 19596]|nr:hypothetical protein AA19596_2279 [Acetobacter fabarum DSM 19596]
MEQGVEVTRFVAVCPVQQVDHLVFGNREGQRRLKNELMNRQFMPEVRCRECIMDKMVAVILHDIGFKCLGTVAVQCVAAV